MCIDAPESTTKKFSFLQFFSDGTGRHHSLVSDKKGSFVLFFELSDILGQSARVTAGTSLLSFNLLLIPSLKIS